LGREHRKEKEGNKGRHQRGREETGAWQPEPFERV